MGVFSAKVLMSNIIFKINDARIIFEKATHVAYLKVDDLASVWCEWVEMELRHNNYEDGLKLMQKATAPPPR